MSIPNENGLISACILDGKGAAKPVGWKEVRTWKSKDGPIWIHLDRTVPETLKWLREESGLTLVTVDAITTEESRPRVFRGKRGYIAILRGINQNEGENPDDMVAIRLWSDGERLITLRHRRLFAPRQIYQELTEEGTGPVSVGALFETIVSRLISQMAGSVTEYEEKLDAVELRAENADAGDLRRELGDIRKDAIELRRFMAPQREALAAMLADPPTWMPEEVKPSIRETMDRQQRLVEELDAIRERGLVIKDDISNKLAEKMNNNMYVISIIAAIFLPLSFFTGLLGINVGGMPGVDSAAAFWVTCVLMVIILIAQIWIFRRLKWI